MGLLLSKWLEFVSQVWRGEVALLWELQCYLGGTLVADKASCLGDVIGLK